MFAEHRERRIAVAEIGCFPKQFGTPGRPFFEEAGFF
jgi:hypothetical protein